MNLLFANLVVNLLVGLLAIYGGWLSYQKAKKQDSDIRLGAWLKDWFEEFHTELAGAALTGIIFLGTVGVLEYQQEQAQEAFAEAHLKEELILNLSSGSQDVALVAVSRLALLGWFHDGTLAGAELWQADLREANLRGASLSFASLWQADLRGADLRGADLRGAFLMGADLREANLRGASLMGASLSSASLWQADLRGADLRGASLMGANLWRADSGIITPTEARLGEITWGEAKLDDQTILPDSPTGNRDDPNVILWTPDTDMSRYTNMNHPDYWSPHR